MPTNALPVIFLISTIILSTYGYKYKLDSEVKENFLY